MRRDWKVIWSNIHLVSQTAKQKWSRGHYVRGQRLKKIRGQGERPIFRVQTLLRPRTGMLEPKAKERGHNFSKLWLADFT